MTGRDWKKHLGLICRWITQPVIDFYFTTAPKGATVLYWGLITLNFHQGGAVTILIELNTNPGCGLALFSNLL